MAIQTTDQLLAAYDENADYDEANSTTKCKAFIVACRRILQRREFVQKGDESVRLNLEMVQAELKEARAWLNAQTVNNSSSGDVRYFKMLERD